RPESPPQPRVGRVLAKELMVHLNGVPISLLDVLTQFVAELDQEGTPTERLRQLAKVARDAVMHVATEAETPFVRACRHPAAAVFTGAENTNHMAESPYVRQLCARMIEHHIRTPSHVDVLQLRDPDSFGVSEADLERGLEIIRGDCCILCVRRQLGDIP